MMMHQPVTPEEMEFASRVLTQFVTDEDRKVQYGLMARRAALKQIAAGQQPSGYRANYVREAGKKLAKFAAQLGQEFNDRFPWDRTSTLDLLDFLATARGHYVAQDREQELGEDYDS